MDTIALAPALIAQVLLRFPAHTLDCASSNIWLSDSHSGESYEVLNLQLIVLTRDPLVGSEALPCYVLRVQTKTLLLELEEWQIDYQFSIPKDPLLPIFNALPTFPLYPLHNAPKNVPNPQVPVYTRYYCSPEEAQRLLQSHIPDLAPEVLASFADGAIIQGTANWPDATGMGYPEITVEYELLNQGQRIGTPQSADCSPAHNEHPAPCLYILRNSIVLNYLMPLLSRSSHFFLGTIRRNAFGHPLLAGMLEKEKISSTTNYGALLNNLLITVSPHLSLQIPPNSSEACVAQLLQQAGAFRVADAFPATTRSPVDAAPSPEQILDKIVQMLRDCWLVQVQA